MIRTLDRALDPHACDAIVASLPEWFGNEEGIRQAAEHVRSHDGLVAERGGRVMGFLTWVFPYPASAEISWMAVHRDARRAGIGTQLLASAAEVLRARGARILLVKTLSDRTDPGPEYAATRAFYLARGFVPVMELDIWGPDNPCQLLAMPV